MVEFTYKSRHKKHADTERTTLDRRHANAIPTSSNRQVCFSFAAYACTVISHLSKCNVPISKGLSDEEFQQIQARFGFDFPPDLRSILQEGLPVGAGFPNWRSSPPKQLLKMINLPAKGLCNEVLRGTFWCEHWGERPKRLEDAVRIARRAFKSAPVLVPIYSLCYIPCFSNLSGNPIFFIFGKDVFYCGYDLADFFGREVFLPLESSLESSERREKRVFGSRQPLISDCERKNMSVIEEDMVMESKLKAAADTKNDGPVYHEYINGRHHHHSQDGHDGYYHSQNQHSQHHKLSNYQSSLYRHQHSHRRSDKEVKWDALNKRLLEELQNTVAKDEPLSRKSLCEEPLHYIDRPPKSLVRSAGNSPRMGQSIMSRYAFFHEKPLPAKVLAQFTIAAPPWAAKMARCIPTWSDLVENKENMCEESIDCARYGENRWPEHAKSSTMRQMDVSKRQERPFDVNQVISSKSTTVLRQGKGSSYVWNVVQRKESSCNVDIAQTKRSQCETPSQQECEFYRRFPKSAAADQQKQGSGTQSRSWLVPYFKDMEKKLRRGGWKQGDIEEMVAALPSDDECFSLIQTRQGVQDVLNGNVNALSLSLQKAGWSVPDVVEILSL